MPRCAKAVNHNPAREMVCGPGSAAQAPASHKLRASAFVKPSTALFTMGTLQAIPVIHWPSGWPLASAALAMCVIAGVIWRSVEKMADDVSER